MNYNKFTDPDGSIKFVFRTEQGPIEISYLVNKISKGYDVLCVPTHYYCGLGCSMCHLTNIKTKLRTIPIKANTLHSCISSIGSELRSDQCLVSFMGVGDGATNMELIRAIGMVELPMYSNTLVSMATMMPLSIRSDLKQLCKDRVPVKIHYSLHSVYDDERRKLIPASTVSIASVLQYLKEYKYSMLSNKYAMDKFHTLHNNNDLTEIHYTLIDGVNDSDSAIQTLIDLAITYDISIKFIKFNPDPDNPELIPSTREHEIVEEVRNRVSLSSKSHLRVKFYIPPGKSIGSSCGQFDKSIYS